MLIDAEARTIRFRQSWVDTALRCAERGRQDAFHPIREEGDAAFAGTSMHAAIEQFLNGRLDVTDMEAYAEQYARNGAEHGVEQDDGSFLPISYKSFESAAEMIYHAGNCTRGWIQDVLPVLASRGELQGQSEARFEFEAFVHNGWTIILQGTCDWIPDIGNRIWDWKSSGSDYKQKDKQANAVQPDTYLAAAVNGCFGREFTLPAEFAYGVAIRLKTKARGQVVVVERTQAHIDWLYRRLRTFVNLYDGFGPDKEWPTNTDHFLCSQKWCSFYESCRGAHITRDMDLFGYVA